MSIALVAQRGQQFETLLIDPDSNLFNVPSLRDTSGNAASVTALAITAPTLVKLGSGRLVTVALVGPGAVTINDATAIGNANQTNILVNFTSTAGWATVVDMPVINGIVVSAITGQATISYQ